VIKLEKLLQHIIKKGYVKNSLFPEHNGETFNFVNFNKYELLGDHLLNYMVVLKLSQMFECYDASQINKLKESVICNDNLERIAKKINLIKYVDHRLYKSKYCDIIEAIIGELLFSNKDKTAKKFVEFLIGETLFHNILVDKGKFRTEYETKKDKEVIKDLQEKTKSLEEKIKEKDEMIREMEKNIKNKKIIEMMKKKPEDLILDLTDEIDKSKVLRVMGDISEKFNLEGDDPWISKLKTSIASSSTLTQAIKKLGVKRTKSNTKKIKSDIEKHGISTDHFRYPM
jgi:hypothetical protein